MLSLNGVFFAIITGWLLLAQSCLTGYVGVVFKFKKLLRHIKKNNTP